MILIFLVQNLGLKIILSKLLQDRLEISMEGKNIYENSKESTFEVFNDLCRSNETRQNSQQFGIANENTRKLISGSDDGASSGNNKKRDKLISDLSQRQKISLSSFCRK